MILRRFMKHVTDQNWFAVGLDVIVVIVGIYLGFQVTEWGRDREDRAQEQLYLDRLHGEIVQALRPANSRLRANQTRYNDLKAIANLIATDIDIDYLSNKQCNSLHMSGIFSSQAALLPTMNELIATGRLAIIENEDATDTTKFSIGWI